MNFVPVPHSSAATSSAICRYGVYLEKVYSSSSVSNDGKFPPTPSKTYVTLAVVERASQICDIEEVRKNMLHGRVDELIKGKTKIELTDILKPQDNGSPVSLVFVEGPPGIGKSTLAWELCRKWDRKQYDLAVLLRLRERKVQQIESIADFFPHINQELQQYVSKEVVDREGKRVLIVLDGYDELPINLRHQELLTKLLKKEVLPECSVLVTSRPSATRDLFRACRPQIKRHVEILGFNQKSVEDYASSVFFSEPEVLKDFLVYISASNNPAINSLMYIPLNAAIIVEIYKNSRRKGSPIPKTMTQVYTQLCLALLQRYLDNVNPQNTIVLDDFNDIPNTYYVHFKKLSRLAFEQFQQHRIVFYSDSVSKELIHFGFLDSVAALYGGGGVSYNFLHLTLQEFLAACHITQLSKGTDIFDCYSNDARWEVVWMFLSGLTGFKYFENSVQNPVFSYLGDKYFQVKTLLLRCLFEGQQRYFLYAETVCTSFLQPITFPLDRYALGYCIANCSSRTSWQVKLVNVSDESFVWGLNSNYSGNGTISHLDMRCGDTHFDSYPLKILHGIEHLEINSCSLEKVIPLMKNLTSLCLVYFPSDNDVLVFSNLLHLLKLKCLRLTYGTGELIPEPICEILFGPSSLEKLDLINYDLEENSLKSLESNTSLTNLTITYPCTMITPFQTLSAIVLHNKTIQKLEIYVISETLDLEQLDTFKAALSTNTSLEEFRLVIIRKDCHNPNVSHDWSLIDPRVTIKCECRESDSRSDSS